jgi:nitroreductase
MVAFYRDNEQLQRDEAMRSCGLIGQTIMLAAQAHGYQSCPMIGFDIPAVGSLINLPADHVIGLMVAIGKGTSAPHPKPGQLPLSEVVIYDQFHK